MTPTQQILSSDAFSESLTLVLVLTYPVIGYNSSQEIEAVIKEYGGVGLLYKLFLCGCNILNIQK